MSGFAQERQAQDELAAVPAAPVTSAAVVAPVAVAAAVPAAVTASPGRVELRACADEAGRLVSDPTVTRSSGDAGLDQAAVRIARSGANFLQPSRTVNGKATSGCAQMAISFEAR